MRAIFFAFSAVAFAATIPAKADAPVDKIAYRHVTLIDGSGSRPQTDMTIVTTGARIAAIAPTRSDSAYLTETVKIEDMTGKFALPGLIDTHVHIATDPNDKAAFAILRRDLYSGVTTVRDMAGDTRVLGYYARAAMLDEVEAPDIYYAALMAGPQFFRDARTVAAAKGLTPGEAPWMRAMTMKSNIPIAVAAAHGTGATALKLYADMPGPPVKVITKEAHRQHMLVWTHAAIFPATPKQIIDADADVVSHVCMLAYQASDDMPSEYHHRAPVDAAKFEGDAANPVIAALFDDMKARGTILDATLYVYEAMAEEMADSKSKPYCSLPLAAKLLKQAREAGVMISTGTDSKAPQSDLFPALYDELELLVAYAGFTPLEAIHAATETGAKAVGQEEAIGALAVGKQANIMFTAKDPSADIGNLKSIVLTVKHGREYRRTDYKPITKDELPNDDF